jgi:hypothetical protein
MRLAGTATTPTDADPYAAIATPSRVEQGNTGYLFHDSRGSQVQLFFSFPLVLSNRALNVEPFSSLEP